MRNIGNRTLRLVNLAGVAVATVTDVSNLLGLFSGPPTLFLVGTENAGAADMDVTVEGSPDGVVWHQMLAFATLAATGLEPLGLNLMAKYMQITCTPSAPAGDWDVVVYAHGAIVDGQGALLP